MRWLGVAALGAVIAQGVLGGLTVLFFLPAAISTAHAGLAEIFFCMTVAIALFTSPGWIDGYGTPTATSTTPTRDRRCAARDRDHRARSTRRFSSARRCGTRAPASRFPDFPLMFGHLVPDHWDREDRDPLRASRRRAARDARDPRDARRARLVAPPRPARAACGRRRCSLALVAVQVTLGALTVLSRRDVVDQQLPRRLRRAGADDVAGADAADLARPVCYTVDSGGGRSAARSPARCRGAGAVDPTIRYSFPVAGSIPLYLRTGGSVGDKEQYLEEFYRIAGYPDLYVLGIIWPGP